MIRRKNSAVRNGTLFGSKVSPWTSAEEDGSFRFGTSGIRASFALGRGGPQAVVANPRFLESAELLMEVWCSTAPTVSDGAPAFWQGAAKVLQKVQDPLDQLSRMLVASLRLPLANVLCGRGFAADRALGGWIQLGQEGPRLWLQAYVLPDHANSVPQLEEQLKAVTGQGRHDAAEAASLPAKTAPRSTGGQQAVMQPNTTASASQFAFGSTLGPWGPAKSTSSTRAPKVASPAPAQDLLDLDLASAPTSAPAASTLEDVDLLGGPENGVDGSRQQSPSLLADVSLVDIPLTDDGPATSPAHEGQSAFAFVGATPSAQQGGKVPGSVADSSAFSFIGAQVKPAPNLMNDAELRALYSSSSPGDDKAMPYLVAHSDRFSALYPGWNGLEPKAISAGGQGAGEKAFEALEKQALSSLMR